MEYNSSSCAMPVPDVAIIIAIGVQLQDSNFVNFQDKLSPVPVVTPVDPVDREVGYVPTKAPYDPRWMLAGRVSPSQC